MLTNAIPDRAALVAAARATIARGSKSFAAASWLFDRPTRERAWLFYAWCRACDDLADAQELGGVLGENLAPAAALAQIEALTAEAHAGRATGVPAFDALGVVARECAITPAHTAAIIAGFALDAAGWRPHDARAMLGYCYHVAGAVGVAMALVMGVAAEDTDTLDRAAALGIAFQLGNIARDIAEDAAAGRCYLPGDWLAEAGIPVPDPMAPRHRPALVALVARLVALARTYEAAARIGAARLSWRSRWAVLAAAGIYGGIARGVARGGAAAWDQRVHTSRAAKLGFVARGLAEALLGPKLEAPPLPFTRAELAIAVPAPAIIPPPTAPARHSAGETTAPVRSTAPAPAPPPQR